MMKNFFELQRFAKTVKLTTKADNYENDTENVKILALGGNDTIKNCVANVTIDGGAGNDSIKNYYGESISGGAGNDNIENSADKVTIVGGAGNDTIYDVGEYGVITGGAGSDSINSGSYSTVTGGAGSDTIWAGNSNVIKYSSGDGNDAIVGFTSSDTLYITKGSYSTMISDNGDESYDFIVKVGSQKITLFNAVSDEYDKVIIKNSSGKVSVYNDWKVMNGTSGDDFLRNAASNVTVNGGKGNDYISNDGSYVTITSGAGNDTVYSFGRNSNISGGAGNDAIYNSASRNSTVSGGDGKDYIDSLGDSCVIDGGKGNDTITAYNSTITGGKGNDTIKLGGENNVVRYASGDGKDTIVGFDSDDTLHITKGSYSVKTSGNDVIVKVGSGSIRLKDAKGQQISIKNSKGKVTTKTYGSASSNVAALLSENNFATSDNLSTIVENNLSASADKIETQNFDTLTQKNNLITFAEE